MAVFSNACSFVLPLQIRGLISRNYKGDICRSFTHWSQQDGHLASFHRAKSQLTRRERPVAKTFCTAGVQGFAGSNKPCVTSHGFSENENGSVAHAPVLVDEVVAHASSAPRVVVDGTVGAGGHAHALLSTYSSITQYIGIDKDDVALNLASHRLREFGEKVCLVHGDFRQITHLTTQTGIAEGHADFVILDVGVSSMQVDDPDRGFSFSRDGPLDMRMDRNSRGSIRTTRTAADIVNNASEDDLVALIRSLGEEPQAHRIARRIVTQRITKPFETTGELASAVIGAKGGWRRKGFHPATLTFQALRVAVNDELHALQEGVLAAVNLLKPGGKICVISFHSLEDRIVKNALRSLAQTPGGVRVITKKPIIASDYERHSNERSRSAKLRVAERVMEGVLGKAEKVNKYKRK